jgi:hypothetical protein
MFFLFDNAQKNHFYQIFIDSNSYKLNDESIVYDLINNNLITSDIKLSLNLTFKICILDNFISYLNINTNDLLLFSFTNKLIESIDLTLNKIIFENIYIKINNSEFPKFIDNDYDNIFYVNFKIFKINKNLFLINELNSTTLINKQYFISDNIDHHILNELSNY